MRPENADPSRHSLAALGLAVLAAISWPSSLMAQPVIDEVQQLDFDAPESWAMKYFASASLFTSLGPVELRRAGAIDLGLEVIQVPHLSTEQRRVGFGGLKVEDLNRSPVQARLRATFGLPAGFGLTVGWSPPVEVQGVKANLFDLALERSLWRGERSGVGARLFVQEGEAEGDLTCSSEDARIPPGEPGNEFGCEAPSNDRVALDYYGLAVVGHYRTGASERSPVVHYGGSVQHLDLEFQVDAFTFGFHDRTLQLTDGNTWAVNAGATFSLTSRLGLGVELFYGPLDVRRPPDFARENDPLLNLRALATYRIR